MADWFYGKDNTQHGPVSEQEIQTLAASGQIDGSTIVWREGMGDWIPMKDVPEFQALAAPTAAAQSTPAAAAPYASPQTHAAVQQPMQAVAPTDTLSIVSLVCGIMAILSSCMYVGVIFGIPAAICGHMSLKKINNSPTPMAGKGMAIAGLVTGYIGSALSLTMIGFVVFAIIAGAASSP